MDWLYREKLLRKEYKIEVRKSEGEKTTYQSMSFLVGQSSMLGFF